MLGWNKAGGSDDGARNETNGLPSRFAAAVSALASAQDDTVGLVERYPSARPHVWRMLLDAETVIRYIRGELALADRLDEQRKQKPKGGNPSAFESGV